MASFTDRFEVFAVEAQTEKDSAMTRLTPLLAEADAILAELAEKGIPVRIELPMAVGTKLTDLRVKAEFSRRLA